MGVADGDLEPPGGSEAVVSEYEGTHRHNGIPDYIKKGIEEKSPQVPPLVFSGGLAVRRGSVKYVATANGHEELFDLSDDPEDSRDLAASRPGLVEGFAPERRAWERRREGVATFDTGEVAEGEIAEHLRELGYIE